MTTLEITLLCLFGISTLFWIILIAKRPDFDKLNIKIKELHDLLSTSTANVNNLISENSNLRSQVNTLKKERQILLEIGVGNRVLIKQELVNKSAKQEFTVLYEADVIEVSLNKLKLSATDFTSHDSWPNQATNRQGVIDFMQDRWVKKSECELITDTVFNRDAKLAELLNETNN